MIFCLLVSRLVTVLLNALDESHACQYVFAEALERREVVQLSNTHANKNTWTDGLTDQRAFATV